MKLMGSSSCQLPVHERRLHASVSPKAAYLALHLQMPGCLYLPVPEPWEALSLQQLAFRELGQTVKKDHQPSGTDPSGERVIATENTWMTMADPERASSGAEEASRCGGPVSESTQCSCQRDGAKTSFQSTQSAC